LLPRDDGLNLGAILPFPAPGLEALTTWASPESLGISALGVGWMGLDEIVFGVSYLYNLIGGLCLRV
jgi:hypothetical protein